LLLAVCDEQRGSEIIRWSITFAVLAVAPIAAVASHERTYDFVRAQGEAGRMAHMAPLTVGWLIYVHLMVMLDSAPTQDEEKAQREIADCDAKLRQYAPPSKQAPTPSAPAPTATGAPAGRRDPYTNSGHGTLVDRGSGLQAVFMRDRFVRNLNGKRNLATGCWLKGT
jgi:hypothetical protein